MQVARTVAELHAALAERRSSTPGPVGLVPTMGAFHEGHGSLMNRARAESATVVVSLFVNPTQFGKGEDLSRYPRQEAADLSFAEKRGVDVLFAPSPGDMYPPGFDTSVEVGGELTSVLDGHPDRRGPAHFRAVATVVLKLLNICAPQVAYFGQKDLQQALVIRRLVRDLDVPVHISVEETVREADGLAMSSRNAYLSPAERARAVALSRSLTAARVLAEAGEASAEAVLSAAGAVLRQAGLEPEYVELRRLEDLSPAAGTEPGTFLALAVTVGSTRLIDNTVFGPVGAARRAPAMAPSPEEVHS